MLAWIHTINETIIRNYALEHSIWWIHIWSIFQLFGWHLSTRTAQQNASHWSNWPKVSELCNFHSVRLIVLISVNAHFCIEFGCHPPPPHQLILTENLGWFWTKIDTNGCFFEKKSTEITILIIVDGIGLLTTLF